MPTGTPLTRNEVIEKLSQCGNLSYSDFVKFLYSIYFLADDSAPDSFLSKFTGKWTQADSDNGKYDADIYVTYNGSIYRSIINNNKNTPGIGNGWEAIGPASSSKFLFADSSTIPGVTDGTLVYIGQKGNYPNFNVTITGAAGFIIFSGNAWNVVNIDIDLTAYVTQIEFDNLKQKVESNFRLGFVSGEGTININQDGLTEISNIFNIAVGNNFYLAFSGDVISSNEGNNKFGINWIFFNIQSNKIRVYNYTSPALQDLTPDNDILLGTFYNLNADTLSTINTAITIQRKRPFENISQFALVSTPMPITIDNTGTVTSIGSGQVVKDGRYYGIQSGSSSIGAANANTTGINLLFFNIETGLFKVYNYTFSGFPNPIELNPLKNLLVNSFYNLDKSTLAIPNDNIVFLSSDNLPTGELLLPAKMFFVKGRTLPLYKESIQRNKKELASRTALLLEDVPGEPNYTRPTLDFFDDQVKLNPDILTDVFKVASVTSDRTGFGKYFYSPIQKVSIDASLLAPQQVKIIHIGDSITNRGLSFFLQRYLGQVAPQISYLNYGTISNDFGLKGEGREGWTYSNFVGRSNLHNDGTIITRANTPNQDYLYANPFLKLATATDKNNHPDWCFRNTGIKNELNYSTDSNKTGDFYIFDIAYYLSFNNLPADIKLFTIALSTNDYSAYSREDALASCLISSTIMVSQIKSALPNAKIGIVSAPAHGACTYGDDRFNIVADWINKSNDVALSFNNVSIIPVWAHQNRYFAFDSNADTLLKNDGGTTKNHINNDFIHFGFNGKEQYAPVVGNWLLNNL